MIYRMRVYRTKPNTAAVFHEFSRTWLLPVQLRRGARLTGRWETEDDRVVALWEYDDRAASERIQTAVSRDPDSRRAQEHRKNLPAMITEQEETFMHSTV